MDKISRDLNIGSICRICLQAEDSEFDRDLINVFSEERGFSIVESLQQICSIQVSKNDNFPQLICSVCLPRLRNAFFLRLLSQRSQQTLNSSRRYHKVAPEDHPAESTKINQPPDAPPFECIEFSDVLADVKSEGEDTVSYADSAVFRCCRCKGEQFDNEKALKRHSIQVHCPKKLDLLLSGKIRCSVCYVVFEDEAEVREHQAKYPNVKTLWGCSYCRCNFFSQDTLEVHISQFHKDRRYKCCGCEFQSDNQIDLATHTLFHKHAARKEKVSAGGFQCAVCFARFETLRKRQYHERLPYMKVDISPVATNEPKKVLAPPESKRPRINLHECDKCSATFPDKESLETHPCIVVYECQNCPKKFISKKTFESHRCENMNCPKKNPDKKSKQRQPLTRRSEKFQCNLCYEYFKNASSLRNHLKTHGPNQSFPCRFCSAIFMRESGRDDHEVRHTGVATYVCEVCGKPSNKRQWYVQHYETTHATDAERIHDCNLCEQRFSKDHFLSNHLYFVHRVRNADEGWKEKFTQREVVREASSADV